MFLYLCSVLPVKAQLVMHTALGVSDMMNTFAPPKPKYQ